MRSIALNSTSAGVGPNRRCLDTDMPPRQISDLNVGLKVECVPKFK